MCCRAVFILLKDRISNNSFFKVNIYFKRTYIFLFSVFSPRLGTKLTVSLAPDRGKKKKTKKHQILIVVKTKGKVV